MCPEPGLRVIDLGLIRYHEALDIQLARRDRVEQGAAETLFLLEHPAVVTLGRQGGREHLLVPEKALAARGVEVVQTTRGGNITCHFPGQVVAYPVLRIQKRPGGVRALFADLEETIIRACRAFGLEANRREGHPGVWVGERRKICSMGLAVRRWVTYHGLALNVGPDLSLFELMTPCGVPDAAATSLSRETGRDIGVKEVKDVLAEEFEKSFAPAAVA